jgi:hypothetical protein
VHHPVQESSDSLREQILRGEVIDGHYHGEVRVFDRIGGREQDLAPLRTANFFDEYRSDTERFDTVEYSDMQLNWDSRVTEELRSLLEAADESLPRQILDQDGCGVAMPQN